MKSWSNWLYDRSSGTVSLIALVIFALFMVFVLPGQAEQAEAIAPGAGSPDTTFLYGTRDLYTMAEAYGAEGRTAYIRARFTFDLVFPVVYGFFLITAVSWAGEQIIPQTSRWRQANLLPVLGVVFDLLENSTASIVMARYPSQTAVIDGLAPFFSVLKWVCIGGSFGLLLILVLRVVQKRL